jgi:hypothetical protein
MTSVSSGASAVACCTSGRLSSSTRSGFFSIRRSVSSSSPPTRGCSQARSRRL